MSLTFFKKLRRTEKGLCENCGKPWAMCACKKPKGMNLPRGITRRPGVWRWIRTDG